MIVSWRKSRPRKSVPENPSPTYCELLAAKDAAYNKLFAILQISAWVIIVNLAKGMIQNWQKSLVGASGACSLSPKCEDDTRIIATFFWRLEYVPMIAIKHGHQHELNNIELTKYPLLSGSASKWGVPEKQAVQPTNDLVTKGLLTGKKWLKKLCWMLWMEQLRSQLCICFKIQCTDVRPNAPSACRLFFYNVVEDPSPPAVTGEWK